MTFSDRWANGYVAAGERGGWRFVWIALVVVFFCVPLFLGLGRTDLRGDEAIYSFSAVRILETGSWVFPESSPHEGSSFLEKPPLKAWLVAAPIRLGLLPNNEFGLRFWDALFGSFAFLYVFAIGRRIAGPLCGSVAVMVLVVQYPLLFEHGLRSNNMEGPLFLAYCGGVYHYLRWAGADVPASRNRHIAAVSAYVFLGFMTKFVAVAFLPFMLFVTSLSVGVFRTQLRRDWWRWLLGFSGALAVAAPWFIAAHMRFGQEFWHIIFGEHVYRRFTTTFEPTHLQPWSFYFADLYRNLQISQTTTLVAGGSALVVARTVWKRWPEGVLLLVWGFLPLGLMSLMTSKLEHYMDPYLPPMALAAGCLQAWIVLQVLSRMSRLTRAFEQRAADTASRFLIAMRRPVMRTILLSLAFGCTALAAATIFYGTVRVSVGGVFLFRTAGVLRPWLVGLLLATLAGRPTRIAQLGVPMVLVIGFLPLTMYRDVITHALVEKHPMRSARDCVLRIQAEAPASMPRGLYVDAPASALLHEDYFYFRKVRPFDRIEPQSDAGLYKALYQTGAQRPVLIADTRYRDLMAALRARDPKLIDALVRTTGASPSEILARGFEQPPGMVSRPLALLLLPGPYAVCSEENLSPRIPDGSR